MAERRAKYLRRLAGLVMGTVMPVAAIAVPAQAVQNAANMSQMAEKYVADEIVMAMPPVCEWSRFQQFNQRPCGCFLQCSAVIGESDASALDLKATLRDLDA